MQVFLHVISVGKVEVFNDHIVIFLLLQMIVVEANGQVLYNKLISPLPLFMGEWLVLFGVHSPLKSQHITEFAQIQIVSLCNVKMFFPPQMT